MSNHRQKKKNEKNYQKQNCVSISTDKIVNKKKLREYYNNHPIITASVAGVFSTIIIGIASAICVAVFNGLKLPYNLEEMGNNINTNIINIVDQKFNELNSNTQSSLSDLRIQVSTLEKVMGLNYYSSLQYSKTFTEHITETCESIENEYYYSAPPYSGENVIATDTITNKTYTEKQLTGQTLLVTYNDNGKDILFYGQYNINNHWEGRCIFNIYENGELDRILDAEYNDGVIDSFEIILQNESVAGYDVWSISKRKNEGKYNSGETWTYFKTADYPINFDINNPEVKDVIFSDNFENSIKSFSVLEGYYSGNTENGKYNDNTGNSYMVKYDRDGFIRTLYIGNFKDGNFEDNTGKAEEIVYDGSVNRYFHYVGTFTVGNRDGDNLKYITQREINEIIEPYNINCELKWRDTTKDPK